MINAANRDPRPFDDPERVNIRRDPNRHIASGYGLHFWVGAPLARLDIGPSMEQIDEHRGDLAARQV